jgi:hypothetical protein
MACYRRSWGNTTVSLFTVKVLPGFPMHVIESMSMVHSADLVRAKLNFEIQGFRF